MLIRISELFHSLQGEGPSLGMPAHFLRLQGCDVACHWCDTKYTWDPNGGRESTLDDAFEELESMGEAPLLVVTGGEPLAHPGIRAVLEAALERWERVEVETSGLCQPPIAHPALFYNWSPKLPSVTARWADTWRHAARFVEDTRTTVKLVVGDLRDEADALRLIEEHRLPRASVTLMPEGLTDAQLRENAGRLAELCKRETLRFSPRLHVWLWGAKRGV
ncbi:MAG: 7-carboxy-7-deazaguanine synthase QueE [Candidatus Eisenbacteria bacterium]